MPVAQHLTDVQAEYTSRLHAAVREKQSQVDQECTFEPALSKCLEHSSPDVRAAAALPNPCHHRP